MKTEMLSQSFSTSYITMDTSRGKWCSLTGGLVFRDKDVRWSRIQFNLKPLLNLVRVITGSLVTAPHVWICTEFIVQFWSAEVPALAITSEGEATSYMTPLLHPSTITLTVIKRH